MDKRIKAVEKSPYDIDFSFYFDNDGFRDEYSFYIPPNGRVGGFNKDEYNEIVKDINNLIELFEDFYAGYGYVQSIENVLDEAMIGYSSQKEFKRLSDELKEWYSAYVSESERTKRYDVDSDFIVDYLNIVSDKSWKVKSFTGYSQGDYCEVIYPIEHYSEKGIDEIGKFWLGCGTEFIIDGVSGYYVIDTIRWKEGDILRSELAELSGYKPEELEIWLYEREKRVPVYGRMD